MIVRISCVFGITELNVIGHGKFGIKCGHFEESGFGDSLSWVYAGF